MSLLSQLKTVPGSKHAPKRLGRGRGSGLGQTSGKGHKGQLARTGGKVRRGFEGGQSPLIRRLPKFGFNNTDFEIKYTPVNLDQLNSLSGDVNPQRLREMGIAKGEYVKILGRGQITQKLNVKAHRFSEAAKKAIEDAGGTTEVLKLWQR
ncbi:MAG: 50S ribosomal protein L15 [Bdellovibrio sp.]